MKNIYRIFILILLIISGVSIYAETNKVMMKAAAYKTLETFCQLEFYADNTGRVDGFIKTSANYENQFFEKYCSLTGENTMGIDTPGSTDIDATGAINFYIIKSYKILSFEVKDDKATAKVSYDVLARASNVSENGLKITSKIRNPNLIEIINLKFDGKYWKVSDPPSPKISINEITAFYEDDVKSISNHKGTDLDEQQLKSYYAYLNEKNAILEELKNLGGDPSEALYPHRNEISPTYGTGSTATDIKRYADLFLQAEFQGDDFSQRYNLIYYSNPQRDKLITLYHMEPHMILWKTNPLFVVSDYKILDIKYKGTVPNYSGAEVTVQYTKLARSQGDGSGGVLTRGLIQDKQNEIVKLEIAAPTHDGWFIIDPPPPHISKDALIAYYENDIKSFGDNYLTRTDITDQQKQQYQKEIDTLEFLRKL